MATTTLVSRTTIIAPLLFMFALVLLHAALQVVVVVHGGGDEDFMSIAVDSFKPAAVCSSAPKGHGPHTLKIIHRHGPCSTLGGGKPDHHQILAHDSLRAASLQSRASGQQTTEAISLPLPLGTSFGTALYFVTLDLGTPALSQTVDMDTGSEVCWVQCAPCQSFCYPQQEPIYDPTTSSTSDWIPCETSTCKQLSGGSCSSDQDCVYSVHYGDNASTTGYLYADMLTVTPTDVFPSFVFGCGQNNQWIFERTAGLFGLGRGPYSLVSQTSSRLGNAFSYCLPQSDSSIGHLNLGSSSTSSPSAVYTPMLTNPLAPIFYFIDLVGISVGGVRLAVPPTVFQAGGTIMDSGTVITRLPPSAYCALRLAFRTAMSNYPLAEPVSLLDTCYDFTGYSTVSSPCVTLHFTGADVQLEWAGVFYVVLDNSRVCLGFAANTDPTAPGIIGSTQQRSLEVIHDIGGQRIGFAPAGTCG